MLIPISNLAYASYPSLASSALNNSVQAIISDTNASAELREAIKTTLKETLFLIQSERTNSPYTSSGWIEEFGINQAMTNRINGLSHTVYQRLFNTLFPLLAKAVILLLDQESAARITVGVISEPGHSLFVGNTERGIHLFYESPACSPTGNQRLMLLTFQEGQEWADVGIPANQPAVGGQPFYSGQSPYDRPPYPTRFMQTGGPSSNPYVLRSTYQDRIGLPYAQRAIYHRSLPPARQKQRIPAQLPSNIHTAEEQNVWWIRSLIPYDYDANKSAADNLLFWMSQHGGEFPRTHPDQQILLENLCFEPTKKTVKNRDIALMFFQFPENVKLHNCEWKYPDTKVGFRNGIVKTSVPNVELWAIGQRAHGIANGNGTVYLMQGGSGGRKGKGEIKFFFKGALLIRR